MVRRERVDFLLGGCGRRSDVATLQDGTAFTFINSFDVSNTGTSNPRANELRDPTLSADQRTLQRWFDTSAVALPRLTLTGMQAAIPASDRGRSTSTCLSSRTLC